MIITISGTAGSGKSTVGKLLAKGLNYKHYSMGDFQRQIAEEKGLSMIELGKLEEKDKSIDQEVDQKQKDLNKEDNFVIDSRLGFHFIPNSLKIFLDADFEVRAKRIFNDDNENRKTEKIQSLEDIKEKMKEREASEIKRYKEYYNTNPYDKINYDLLIDSTDILPDAIVKKIVEFIEKPYK